MKDNQECILLVISLLPSMSLNKINSLQEKNRSGIDKCRKYIGEIDFRIVRVIRICETILNEYMNGN